MSTLVEEMPARAKALSAEDRSRLADELLDSLHGQSDADADADVAWAREIERRFAQTESGAAKLIPAADIHAQARHLIQTRRQDWYPPKVYAAPRLPLFESGKPRLAEQI